MGPSRFRKSVFALTSALFIPAGPQVAATYDALAAAPPIGEPRRCKPVFPDGRSSVAMLQLIERARGYASSRSGEVDRLMGESLAAVAKREPEGLLIVFAGNIHSRPTRYLPRPEPLR